MSVKQLKWTRESARLQQADGQRNAFDGIIAVEGRSLNGVRWTPQALQSGVAVFQKALMFIDHPTAMELWAGDGRSVEDLAGRVHNPYIAQGADGKSELRGTFQITQGREWLNALIAEGILTDLSLEAYVEGADDEETGDFVVERFLNQGDAGYYPAGVALVTYAAAGGALGDPRQEAVRQRVQQAYAAHIAQQLNIEFLTKYRPDLVAGMQVKEAHTPVNQSRQEEGQVDLHQQIKALEERQDRRFEAERILQDVASQNSALPERARYRASNNARQFVDEAVDAKLPMSELRAKVEQAFKEERDYLASIVPNGAVSGLFQSDVTEGTEPPSYDALQEAEYKRYLRLGLSDQQAKAAAYGVQH